MKMEVAKLTITRVCVHFSAYINIVMILGGLPLASPMTLTNMMPNNSSTINASYVAVVIIQFINNN